MALKTIVQMTDDLDGSPADETVEFELDGATYSIDLSHANARALREHFAPFIARARRVKGKRRGGLSSPVSAQQQRRQNEAIRDWARRNGRPDLAGRGRIADDVRDAYFAATGAPRLAS